MFWGNKAAAPEYATAQIAVFWDMNDCPVPDGYDARRVRSSIEGAFKKLGYSGPVSITAFGDLAQIPHGVLRGLSSTGVGVQQTVTGINGTLMFSAILKWRRHNPPPATMMLISDQVEDVFSFSLCRLQQMDKYNLVLGYTKPTRKASVLVTSAQWVWESLLAVPETSRVGLGLQTTVVSETSRLGLGLQKCSKTGEKAESAMLYCESCAFYAQSLEHFTEHLSSQKHAREEDIIKASIRPKEEQADFRPKVEISPKSKRLRKASSTGFRILHKRLRRTRREDLKPARKSGEIVAQK